jgi:hypothetical protein
MRPSRRVLIALALAAVLTTLPTAASAAPWSGAAAAPDAQRAWTGAWQALGQILEWLTEPRRDGGCSADPNGGPTCPPAKIHPRAGRPHAVRPDGGCGMDPNGGSTCPPAKMQPATARSSRG